MKKKEPGGDYGSDHYLGEEHLDADAIGGRDEERDKRLTDGRPAEKDRPTKSGEQGPQSRA
jgi:hypothetical protein